VRNTLSLAFRLFVCCFAFYEGARQTDELHPHEHNHVMPLRWYETESDGRRLRMVAYE
jgi:hypothetical protein